MSTNLNVNFNAVTTNTVGAPLIDPIDHYEVSYYTGSPVSGLQPSVEVLPPATSVTINGVLDGVIGVRVRAHDTEGRIGAWTDYVVANTSGNPPVAPGSLTVDFDQV